MAPHRNHEPARRAPLLTSNRTTRLECCNRYKDKVRRDHTVLCGKTRKADVQSQQPYIRSFPFSPYLGQQGEMGGPRRYKLTLSLNSLCYTILCGTRLGASVPIGSWYPTNSWFPTIQYKKGRKPHHKTPGGPLYDVHSAPFELHTKVLRILHRNEDDEENSTWTSVS
jgi:hypothetical protein